MTILVCRGGEREAVSGLGVIVIPPATNFHGSQRDRTLPSPFRRGGTNLKGTRARCGLHKPCKGACGLHSTERTAARWTPVQAEYRDHIVPNDNPKTCCSAVLADLCFDLQRLHSSCNLVTVGHTKSLPMPPSRRSYGADYAAAPVKSSIRIRPRIGPSSPGTVRMPRRTLMLIIISAFLGFSLFMMFRSRSSSYSNYLLPTAQEEVPVNNEVLLGTATAPKLENATLKYVFYKFL